MYKITVPAAVWQWDINDTIAVEGIEDISKWQVHFASTGDSNALVLEINPDMTCYIPNQLVELGQAIYAYLYNVEEQRAYTETAVLISVKARPRPLDYISEPTDVLTWGQLRADIGTLSQLATEDKTNLVVAVNELHSDIETAHSEIDNIETAMTEQDQSITTIQSEIEKIEQSITNISNTDKSQSQQIAQNQQGIDKLTQTVDKGFKQISAELDTKQPKGDYITNAVDNLINYYKKTETYTQDEVNALVSGLTHITVQVVNSVADVTQPNIIYLVPTGGTGNDSYDEYLYVNGKPERIGSMRVDLSQYYTKSETYSRAEIDSALSGKQPIGDYATTTALTEGLNTKQPVGNYVTSVNNKTPVNGNVDIDAVSVTAGDGIDISESGVVSVINPMDDKQVSAGTTWSSLNIIQKLTTPFTETGNTVTCYPVEGSPLYVVSDITAVQEGEGDPSPENIRPISGWDGANLVRSGQTYTADFPDTVYGGTLDWATGVLTVDSVLYQFTGNESINQSSNTTESAYCVFIANISPSPVTFQYADMSNSYFSHGSVSTVKTMSSEDNTFAYNINSSPFIKVQKTKIPNWDEQADTTQKVALMTNYIKSQYQAGTPLTVCYTIEPYTIQLTPAQILAISGINTVYCDTGDVTVTGYEDPRTTIANLSARIAALESAAANI